MMHNDNWGLSDRYLQARTFRVKCFGIVANKRSLMYVRRIPNLFAGSGIGILYSDPDSNLDLANKKVRYLIFKN